MSRDFTGAAAAAPNTPQDCRAHGKLARPRRHSEWSVKPSAKPTQVRTLDLPPRTAVQARYGFALMPERERSVTPLAMPMSRARPTWWQVNGLADGAPRVHVADLRRMHGEVYRAAADLRAAHNWPGVSFRSASPLGATKISVSSNPGMIITDSNQRSALPFG